MLLPQRLQEMGEGSEREQVCVNGRCHESEHSRAAAHLRSVIFVSLRMAASAVTPTAPRPLTARLRARGRMGNGERVGVSMGIDTKANARAAVHSRLVIFVSLRMAASAEAPFSPI